MTVIVRPQERTVDEYSRLLGQAGFKLLPVGTPLDAEHDLFVPADVRRSS